jgi:hypothetical protein
MDITAANEKQLLADIDRLREEFTQTQDLYREVCILLFFRYGMTPTANKLYQLVRKGSMTAPAEALNKFWGDLREKSRVRIEHPDLPEALKTAAGDLTATLWSAAQAQAHETLASLRGEAQVIILEAKAALTAAETERDTVRQTLQKIQRIRLDRAKPRSEPFVGRARPNARFFRTSYGNIFLTCTAFCGESDSGNSPPLFFRRRCSNDLFQNCQGDNTTDRFWSL